MLTSVQVPRQYSGLCGYLLSPLFLGLLLVIIALVWGSREVVAQETYETAPVLRASSILPPELLRSPNHRVEEEVTNDGLMNHYTITSQFGALTATSTAELHERVYELQVVAQLNALQGTKEFAKGVGSSAGKVVEGAKGLVTQPVETVSSAVSGVGKLFQRAGDSLFGDPASKSEDPAIKSLIGFSSVKRAYAKQFGVDPYSANPILQKYLEEVAWSGYAGGLGANVALAAIPGGIGIAVSVPKNVETLRGLDLSVPPTDLRRRNRTMLTAMGVKNEVIDLFLGNTIYSPATQTLFVIALNDLDGVENRDVLVKVASRTDSLDVARFRQRQAEMYAGYHRRIKPLARFRPVGEVANAETTDGNLVVAVPTDYVSWVPFVAHAFEVFAHQDGASLQNKEIWLAGGVSPRARTAVQQSGWTVVEQAETKLLNTK